MSEALSDAQRKAIVARIKRAARLARELVNNSVDNVSTKQYPHSLNPEN